MSDETAAAARAGRHDWLAQHKRDYLASGGAVGHVVDLSSAGGRAFTTHCLLRYVGRRSGRSLVTPLIYGNFAGQIAVIASKGGADSHPDWYLNIRERPTVGVQVATKAFCAAWREPRGAERDEVWRFMVGLYPPYASYQAATDRLIPILLLQPGEPIAVFTPADSQGERQL
jgi:deazaflavin-dependent oxidoreductase (nitroreductase family)